MEKRFISLTFLIIDFFANLKLYMEGGKEMKKMAIVFVVLVFLFCLTGKVFAGGVYIDFVALDKTSKSFKKEFISQMLQKKVIIDQLDKDYLVICCLESLPDEATTEARSAIRIFINDRKHPVFEVWLSDLFSLREIKKKAKEAVDNILGFLERIEGVKRNSIKIPV